MAVDVCGGEGGCLHPWLVVKRWRRGGGGKAGVGVPGAEVAALWHEFDAYGSSTAHVRHD